MNLAFLTETEISNMSDTEFFKAKGFNIIKKLPNNLFIASSGITTYYNLYRHNNTIKMK